MQKNNNGENFQNIINKHSDTVYRIALTRCKNKDDAEDIFQNVFLKYAEKIPKFKSDEHEKAWFIKVTINMTKNELNKYWNKNVESIEENISNLPSNTYENEKTDDILLHVNNLPLNYKTAIYLMYYEGYKINEIAKLMATNENTIKTWLFRAKQVLKEKIEGGF